MTSAKPWTADAVETLLGTQGIALAPGRPGRLASALSPAANVDPSRAQLEFDVDPTAFAAAFTRCKAS